MLCQKVPAMINNPHMDVWEIDERGFPTVGTLSDKLRFCLRYAILAPSSHNAQPWLFALRDDRIELYADRSRSLHTTDPHDRQLIIGCGCALHHLRVAMRHFGMTPDVEILPDDNDQDLLARVTVAGEAPPDDDNDGLFEAIPKRRTNRQLFKDTPLPHGLEHELTEAVEAEGCWAHFCHDEIEREKIAGLIAAGDRIQWADKRFRLELAAWTHPGNTPSSDGIPNSAMNAGDLLSVAGPMVIRTFDLGDGQAAKDSDIARYSPGLVVIGSEHDSATAWLQTGQALSRLLLLSRQHHIFASFLNQPVETESLRPRLAETIQRQDYPQLILRLGYGPEVNPTPRRTVDEVII